LITESFVEPGDDGVGSSASVVFHGVSLLHEFQSGESFNSESFSEAFFDGAINFG